jgi:hypothetical protein
MVDRGADMTFLSQYPHEEEVLFAPLAGFEVKHTRVEGQVLVVVLTLSVNLTAQTLEQVIEKRRRLLCEMCEHVSIHAHQVATMAPSWQMLREARGEAAVGAAERLLQSVRRTIEMKEPAYYNVNANLVDGATWVLGVADAVEGWGDGLAEVLDNYCALNREQARLGQLLLLESLDLTNRKLELNAAHGLAALLYLSPTLTELIVPSNYFGDAGVAAIATALGANAQSRLQGLFLKGTHAGERAGRALMQMAEHNTSLTKIDLRGNGDIDIETRQALQRVCEQRRGRSITLYID